MPLPSQLIELGLMGTYRKSFLTTFLNLEITLKLLIKEVTLTPELELICDQNPAV
jgi:hypothetical protein